MIIVTPEKCKSCSICVRNCPVDAIHLVGDDKKAKTNENCVNCGICVRVCPFGALEKNLEKAATAIVCTHCPVSCAIPLNKTGACKRYTNTGSELVRNRKLVVDSLPENPEYAELPSRPLITAVGSGTNYPCCRPAPYIVEDVVNGIDVVTVVTEAPLSYSGVKVKIDTNFNIGEEGAKLRRDGKIVGMITTEEYGSKMLTIGGANLLSAGNDGFIVARTIVDLANSRPVTLKVEKGATLEICQGKAPIIDGVEDTLMRVGCGSATVGLFAHIMSEAVDEVIVLDHHVVGLLSEHFAGEEVGMTYTGVVPKGTRSTRGRYFGNPGHGLGGTDVMTPVEAVASIDMSKAKPGMTILVTETTARVAGLLEVQPDGSVKEIDMTPKAQEVIDLIASTCEQSSVSVIYTGGTGGSARGGVTRYPRKISEAVHAQQVRMSVAGAPVFLLPGGGINFMANVDQMVPEPITWVPTPATVAPVEYTLKKSVYLELGGHEHFITKKSDLLKELAKQP